MVRVRWIRHFVFLAVIVEEMGCIGIFDILSKQR